MRDLAANNAPSPPQTQPWPAPLPIPLHQLSFTFMHASCMAHISPFFPRLRLDFFKRPSLFPAATPQGSTPPPGFASTKPRAAFDGHGAYSFAQFGCGVYGVGGSCFVGPYGCLHLSPIQLQLKVCGRESSRVWASEQRMVELMKSRGTGVFHPPDLNRGDRNKKRRKKRGKRNENNGGVLEQRAEGSVRRRSEEDNEEWAQSSHANYDVLLPTEWPY